jgi:hypothetical protein
MTRICRILFQACWGLGILSLLAALVLKALPAWADSLGTSPRGGLALAAVLFLCALATREMGKTASPTG